MVVQVHRMRHYRGVDEGQFDPLATFGDDRDVVVPAVAVDCQDKGCMAPASSWLWVCVAGRAAKGVRARRADS